MSDFLSCYFNILSDSYDRVSCFLIYWAARVCPARVSCVLATSQYILRLVFRVSCVLYIERLGFVRVSCIPFACLFWQCFNTIAHFWVIYLAWYVAHINDWLFICNQLLSVLEFFWTRIWTAERPPWSVAFSTRLLPDSSWTSVRPLGQRLSSKLPIWQAIERRRFPTSSKALTPSTFF